jgi:enoyl-CoA hydratase
MNYENVLVERDGPVGIITINRPQVLNALNDRTVAEIDSALEELGADSEIRVIIITGAGSKAFVSGADINELRALQTAQDAAKKASIGQKVLRKIETMPKPVIAAINGYALGGGCEIAMACDIRVAADSAKLGQPEINLGILPGYGGTQRLPRLIGRGRAKLLLFTGEMVDASEAYRLGLVDRVVPAAELMDQVKALAHTIASKAPVALSLIKEAVNRGMEMPLDDANAFEAFAFGLVATTEDRLEGTSAFLEKRKPQFKGR